MDADRCLWERREKDMPLVALIMNVDDLVFAVRSRSVINEVIAQLHTSFLVKITGPPQYFLGLNVDLTQRRTLQTELGDILQDPYRSA